MDKLIPVQGVDHPTFGGTKLHDSVNFPDFSAFPMTIAGGAVPGHTTEPAAQGASAAGPAPGHGPDVVSGPGPAHGADRGRLNAPPFSWLGSDAWPNFALWQDKPS